ncbi:MAG: hypothetical protein EA369_01700 [Bradymonadales bacterium]|nr:MAG: hypothetical protein EA369_01700 [Bradymonadales bacterium]
MFRIFLSLILFTSCLVNVSTGYAQINEFRQRLLTPGEVVTSNVEPIRYAKANIKFVHQWMELDEEQPWFSDEICLIQAKIPVYDVRGLNMFHSPVDVIETCSFDIHSADGIHNHKLKIEMGGFIAIADFDEGERKVYLPWYIVQQDAGPKWVNSGYLDVSDLHVREVTLLLEDHKRFYKGGRITANLRIIDTN